MCVCVRMLIDSTVTPSSNVLPFTLYIEEDVAPSLHGHCGLL